jgi:hypothetical protein
MTMMDLGGCMAFQQKSAAVGRGMDVLLQTDKAAFPQRSYAVIDGKRLWLRTIKQTPVIGHFFRSRSSMKCRTCLAWRRSSWRRLC